MFEVAWIQEPVLVQDATIPTTITSTNAYCQSVSHSKCDSKCVSQTGSPLYFQANIVPSSPQITTGGANLTLQNFTPQQIQNLIAQFNSRARLQEHLVSSSSGSHSGKTTVTDHGVMASTSTSGIFPFPSTSLTNVNSVLRF